MERTVQFLKASIAKLQPHGDDSTVSREFKTSYCLGTEVLGNGASGEAPFVYDTLPRFLSTRDDHVLDDHLREISVLSQNLQELSVQSWSLASDETYSTSVDSARSEMDELRPCSGWSGDAPTKHALDGRSFDGMIRLSNIDGKPNPTLY